MIFSEIGQWIQQQPTPESSPEPSSESPTTGLKRNAGQLCMTSSPPKRPKLSHGATNVTASRGRRDNRTFVDNASTTSSIRAFLDAPALSDGDPGASQPSGSRASSPTKQLQDRMKRAQLRHTTPPFVMGTLVKHVTETIDGPYTEADLPIPDHINDIVRTMDWYEGARGCIPANLQDAISTTWPESVGTISPSFFTTSSTKDPHWLATVKEIYREASEAFREYKDESAWQSVVEKILRLGLPQLEVITAQTKQVYSELLPVLAGLESQPLAIARVKVDLHIALKGIKDAENMLRRAALRSESGSVSAFHSPEAESKILTALVEVKGMHGTHEEAIYQCSVASAALQKRMDQIEADGDDESLYRSSKPVVSFIVLGHSWFSQVTFRQTDNSVRVLASAYMGGTSSIRDLFTLLGLLENYQKWVRTKFWPFLRAVYS